MTKTNDDAKQTQLMTDCYNLLLNPDIFPEERELLLIFKKEVEAGRDFQDNLTVSVGIYSAYR